MTQKRLFGGASSMLVVGAFGLALATSVVATRPAQAAQAATAARCDEACLKAFMDKYLDALSHHDPSRLPAARNLRFTENAAAVKLGEGLWVTFGSLGPYRHDFYDPSTGGVATLVSATENGFPDLVAIRLKVAAGKITEVETVISRNARGASNLPPKDPSWMQAFDRVEPPARRLTREQLIKGAIDYMRSIAFQKGSIAPFAESCIRLENGGAMSRGPNDTLPGPGIGGGGPAGTGGNQWLAAVAKTMEDGLGCSKQIDTKVYGFITGYEGARFPVVDVQRQIVYGVFDFMRRGNVKTVEMGGKTYDMMANTLYPNEMLNAEAWKFIDGKIARIEAVFSGPQAYNLGNGWPGGTAPVSRPNDQ
jgi:hypothetical protein